jgi:hypothetical protein
MFKIRCAVEGCKLVEFASLFKLTGSSLRASASSRFIILSMTWIEVLPFAVATFSFRLLCDAEILHGEKGRHNRLTTCGQIQQPANSCVL